MPSWDDYGRVSYAKPRSSMHGSTVVLISILTSAVTSVGSIYLVQRYDIFPKKVEVVQTTVPDFKGLPEADARANAQAAHLALIVSSREPSAEMKAGSVIRQSIPAGQRVPHDHPVTVVVADELPKVPVVTGLKLADAKALLEKQGYVAQGEGRRGGRRRAGRHRRRADRRRARVASKRAGPSRSSFRPQPPKWTFRSSPAFR